MHKFFLIAKRDYLAAIKSKPFLFGLIVTPLLSGGGFIGIGLMKAKPDIEARRIAIVDHTGAAADAIIQAATEKNERDLFDKVAGRQVKPRYSFEKITTEPDAEAQRFALCDRVRQHELFAFLEIGRDVLHPPKLDLTKEKLPESARIGYYSNAGGIDETRIWLSGPIDQGLVRARLAQLGVERGRLSGVFTSSTVDAMKLLERDARTGTVRAPGKKSDFEFAAPMVMVVLMVLIVALSAGPMLGAVAEDKMQRVFEMLLASATPFELIGGKVIAAVALSFTSSILYVGAGLVVLQILAMTGLAPFSLMPWFIVYVIADVMVLCSLAAALGASCAIPSDAQHLALPLFIPVMVPMFVIAPVMQQPNGSVATVLSLIPPFTPVIMLMRQSMPGGVPGWQPWVGLIGVLAWVLAASWAAARVFRVGVLMQGKTPNFAQLARWAVRG
jgi:ABC-2 type transport system permease protein